MVRVGKISILSLLVLGLVGYSASCSASPSAGGGGSSSSASSLSFDTVYTNRPADTYGWLQVTNGKVCDQNGNPVQLRGMSLFWNYSDWEETKYYNAKVLNWLADHLNASVIRAAMGANDGSYSSSTITTVVDAAIDRGIYAIIDWHEEKAVNHLTQASNFFVKMANLYKNNPNVIFEIYNEPNGPAWPAVKAYAVSVIGGIRATGSSNLIIVGTPTWSQDVDTAATDPVAGYDNIAYTLHFYAATHKQSLRDKAAIAINSGLALFVTEWGTCSASGNGALDLAESQIWINFLNQNSISWCNWTLGDKYETSSALVRGASASGVWSLGSLTESGKFVFNKILNP